MRAWRRRWGRVEIERGGDAARCGRGGEAGSGVGRASGGRVGAFLMMSKGAF